MKEKIDAKLEELVNAIINKDVMTFTKGDYEILVAERRRIIYEVENAENAKKMREALMTSVFSSSLSAY